MIPRRRRRRRATTSPLLAIIVFLSCSTSTTRGGGGDWVDDCRADGFDPDRLACATCQHLQVTAAAAAASDRCNDCCQAWLDTPRITRPFQAAILIERTSSFTQQGDELTNFLKEDWKEVVRDVQSPNRLHHVVDSKAMGASSYFSLGRQRIQPSQLLFFDDAAAADPKQDVTKLQEAAQDTFNLNGLKREDIKDMILTLMPSKKK